MEPRFAKDRLISDSTLEAFDTAADCSCLLMKLELVIDDDAEALFFSRLDDDSVSEAIIHARVAGADGHDPAFACIETEEPLFRLTKEGVEILLQSWHGDRER